MYVTLMKEEKEVCKLSIHCLSLMGIIVKNYSVIDNNLLPFQLPEDPEIAKLALRKWLEERMISNSDPVLDQTIFEVYGLNPCNYGRMYGYQTIGALLSYMTSSVDEYWCNPTGTQYLSYAMIDHNCNQLYEVQPTTYQKATIAGGKFRRCLRNP